MNNFKKIIISCILLSIFILPGIILSATPPADGNYPSSKNNQPTGGGTQTAAEKAADTKKDTGNKTPPKDVAGTSADKPLITCGGLNKDGTEQPACTVGDLNKLVQSVLNLVFIFAGLIAASMFMYAGFLMVTAAGNASQIQKAKEVFKRVVIGFLIMFLAYVTVKNLLTKLDLKTDINTFFMKLFK